MASRTWLATPILVVLALFESIAGAQTDDRETTNWLFESGFEPPGRIEFVGDQSALFVEAGESHEFEIRVLDSTGLVVDPGVVSWLLDRSDQYSVEVTGTTTARITATTNQIGNVMLRVRSTSVSGAVRGHLTFAMLSDNTVRIQSSLVVSITESEKENNSVRLVRNVQTESLTPGTILLSGDSGGLLEEIIGITVNGSFVDLTTQRASLVNSFDQLEFRAQAEPIEIAREFEVDEAGRFFIQKGDSFDCRRTSGGPSIFPELKGTKISVNFNLEPDMALSLTPDLAAVEEFTIALKAKPTIKVVAGSIEVGLDIIDETLECALELAKVKTPGVPLGSTPITLALGAQPKIGIKFSFALGGPGIKVIGPTAQLQSTAKIGITYSNATDMWVPSYGSGLSAPEFSPIQFEVTPGVTIEAGVTPFATLETEIIAALGNGAASISLLEVAFAELTGSIKGEFELGLPLQADQAGYRGPVWSLKAVLEGKLKAALSGGVFTKIAKAVGVPTLLGVEVELFAPVEKHLAGSPKIDLATDCAQPCLVGPGEPVALQATTGQPETGTLDLAIFDTDAGVLVDTLQSQFAGSADFDLAAPGSSRDTIIVEPRLTIDDISKLMPYADIQEPVQISTSAEILGLLNFLDSSAYADSAAGSGAGGGQCNSSDKVLVNDSRQAGFAGNVTSSSSASSLDPVGGAGSGGSSSNSIFTINDDGSYIIEMIATGSASAGANSGNCNGRANAITGSGASRQLEVLIPMSYSYVATCQATASDPSGRESSAGGTVSFSQVAAVDVFACGTLDDTEGVPIGSGTLAPGDNVSMSVSAAANARADLLSPFPTGPQSSADGSTSITVTLTPIDQ